MHCKNKILVLFTVVFIAMSIGCVKKSRYSKGKDNLDFEEVIPQEQFLLKQEDQTLIKPIKKSLLSVNKK